MEHDYPSQLAAAALSAWPPHAPPAPSHDRLASILSTCFLASLLREEERPILFRLMIGPASALPEAVGPPAGLQVLCFKERRDFTPSELRRLSPAVEFHRAMVGAACDGDGPRIWGILHTGTDWVRQTAGGRMRQQELPPWPVVHVTSPGELSVYCGTTPLATLRNGSVAQNELDVFESGWLPGHFAAVRAEAMAVHRAERERAPSPWGELDPDFVRTLAQHVLRRTISVMRSKRHGGTLLFLPPGDAARADGSPLHIKYGFRESAASRRFRTLLVDAMNALARSTPAPLHAGWSEYSANSEPYLAELDEAIFEVGHLFAGLSAVDGALVLNQRFEVLGFGAEISGAIPDVDTVWRALDVEAARALAEPADTFGTRHRSVFRLCGSRLDVLAVVVSQDGQVRFIKAIGDRVVYFDHGAVGTL